MAMIWLHVVKVGRLKSRPRAAQVPGRDGRPPGPKPVAEQSIAQGSRRPDLRVLIPARAARTRGKPRRSTLSDAGGLATQEAHLQANRRGAFDGHSTQTDGRNAVSTRAGRARREGAPTPPVGDRRPSLLKTVQMCFRVRSRPRKLRQQDRLLPRRDT